jgi:enoyl-CoA hydratase
VISFARPERLNALSADTMTQLRAALLEMGGRRDIRAVILRGDGRAFCAGLDLQSGLGVAEVPDRAESVQAGLRVGTDAVWAIRTIPQPVIAVVHGHAVGAGFAFAAAADVRFIGPGAKFSAPFLKVGMTVGDLGLSWFLPRLIGHGRASQLFFSAGVLDAEHAATFGLASHVSEDPLAEAFAYAEGIAGFPPYGVSMSKEVLNANWSSSLRDHLDAEARAQTIGLLTEGAQLAMNAALARTKKGARP